MSLLHRATPARGSRSARTLLAATAAGSLLLLSACSGGEAGGDDGSTTLTFFSWDAQPVMQPIIDAFEEANPDITVEFSSAPPVAEYISTLQTRLSSGTAADVFVMAAENKSDLIENEAVLPLTDEPFMANLADFNRETYSADGEVYAVSTSSWGGGIVYNTELTGAAGMSEPPATWEELLDLMADIKDATGVAPFYEGLQEPPMSFGALLGSAIQGDTTIDQQIFAGESTFADTWTEPIQTWYEPYEQGLISTDVIGLNGDQVIDEFINGRVAMVATGPWTIPTIREGAPDLEFGYMPIPAPEGQETYLPGAASPGWAINADTENVEAAKEFLAFLASPEGVELYNQETAAITTTTDFEPVVDPVLETVVEPIRAGNVYLAQISWPQFQDTLTTEATAAFQQVLLGQLEPADIGANLDRELQEQQG